MEKRVTVSSKEKSQKVRNLFRNRKWQQQQRQSKYLDFLEHSSPNEIKICFALIFFVIDLILPGVPGILTFIDKNIEPLIF